MKKYIFITAMLAAMAMISCNERPYIDAPGAEGHDVDTIPILIADTNGIEISIDSAIAICKSLAVNAETGELYKLSGVITKNTTNPMNVPTTYDNINFDLADGIGKTALACFYTNNLNNQPFRKGSVVPRVGSKVTVIGVLTLYQKAGSTYAPTPELKNGFIVRIDSLVAPPPFPGCPEPAEGQTSTSEAAIAALQLADGSSSEKEYDVLGVVTEVLEFSSGKATYIISDGKRYFEVYQGIGLNKETFPSAEYIVPNDTVVVHCKLKNFKGTPETDNNAYLVSTTNANYK